MREIPFGRKKLCYIRFQVRDITPEPGAKPFDASECVSVCVSNILLPVCNIYKQCMKLFLYCPVISILQNVFLQNMIYINSNTRVHKGSLLTDMLQLTYFIG